jgi:F0F1-type ATP synthase membrane subunit c/vacuolar-type H+-ATPase subunit K
MHDDETPRPGSLTTRQMVIAFAIIEASVLIPVFIYLIWKH